MVQTRWFSVARLVNQLFGRIRIPVGRIRIPVGLNDKQVGLEGKNWQMIEIAKWNTSIIPRTDQKMDTSAKFKEKKSDCIFIHSNPGNKIRHFYNRGPFATETHFASAILNN